MGSKDIDSQKDALNQANAERIAEFLQETGSVEVISVVDSTGYKLGELEDELDVSRAYINKRLSQAVEYGLLEIGIRDGDKVYQQTIVGEAIRDQMRSIALFRAHDKLREARDQYLEVKSEFLEWADDKNIDNRMDEKSRFIEPGNFDIGDTDLYNRDRP